MRFIDLVNQKPLIDPVDEPSAFAEPSSSFQLPNSNGKRPGLPTPNRSTAAPRPLPTQSMDTQIVSTLPHSGKRSKVWYVVGAFAFLGLGLGIGLLASNSGGSNAAGAAAAKASTAKASTASQATTPTGNNNATPPPTAKPPTPTAAGATAVAADRDKTATAEAASPAVRKKTGFDIRVTPEGTSVRLDGKDIGHAPLRVRNLKAGAHSIELLGPEGYAPVKKDVELGVGEAKELNIELTKAAAKLPETIVASFTSEPPGATVSLFADDQKLISKTTPIKMKLRTGHDYRAEFTRKGYTKVSKALEITDGSELEVAAVLEAVKKREPVRVKMRRAHVRRAHVRHRAHVRRRARVRRRDHTAHHQTRVARRSHKRKPRRAKKMGKGYGMVLVGSKPPCSIYVDGRPTGKTTPDRLRLKAGRHRVSLVNRKYHIRRTVSVRVRAGKRTRVIRDFSDKVR